MNLDRRYLKGRDSRSNRPVKCRFIAYLLCCLLLPCQTLADLASANQAREQGDLDRAIQEYRELAEAGDAIAQTTLGYMYHVGEGIEQDHAMAVHWYRSAANLDNTDAQYNLAVAHAFGEGVSQDYAAAVEWYKRAAAQEHAIAQYSLGLSYSYGEGIERDLETAAYWLARSAQNGYVRAQVLLASKYHTGNGLPLNYEEAARWYRSAAEQEDAIAQFNLASMYRSGTGVAKDLEEALKWYRLSAQQGFEAAQEQLLQTLRILEVNTPDGLNPTEVSNYTQQPVVLPTGGETGIVAISNAVMDLPDVSEPEELSDPLTADQESPPVSPAPPAVEEAYIPPSLPLGINTGQDRISDLNLEQLVKRFQNGLKELSRHNYDDAIPLIQSAAMQGDASAQYHLGTLYYQGLGLQLSYDRAALWFRRAAAQGNVNAQFSIGNMYLMGEGLPQSDSQARYWYQQAANKGHNSAQHNLQSLNRLTGIPNNDQNYSME